MFPWNWQFVKHIAPFLKYPYTGNHINCPVCGGEGRTIAKLDRKLKRLSTDLCQDCGLFFTNPMPTDEELDEYYKSMYRSAYVFAFKAPPKDHVLKKKKDAERRSNIILELYGSADNRKTLDFGCGLGELVNALEKHGFDASGFEPGELWARHANNPKIKNGAWQSIDYEKSAFDFISIMHVLEHLRSPLDCLRKIEGLLKDDGLLWIEVPDMQAYSTKNHKRFHFAHVLGFSRDNLINAAAKCGFYPVQEISKERINKRRSQISIIFRKARTEDRIDVDLPGTAEKNSREYGEYSAIKHALRSVLSVFESRADRNNRAKP